MNEEDKKSIIDSMSACLDDFIANKSTVAGIEAKTASGDVTVVVLNRFYHNLFIKIAAAASDQEKLDKIREIIDF